MYDGLIEFIESSLFGVINRIETEESQGLRQVEQILALLLNFAQRNHGHDARAGIGDALVNENERLQARINLLQDKIEAAINRRCALPRRRNSSRPTPISARWPMSCSVTSSVAGTNTQRAASRASRWRSGKRSGRCSTAFRNELSFM